MFLALDIATSTGFAIGSPVDGPVEWGTHTLPRTGADHGRFLQAYRDWLVPLIREKNISRVVYEAPIMPMAANIQTTRKLYALCGLTELLALDFDLVCQEAQISKWRRHFFGKGNAGGKRAALKKRAIAECRRRGWEVKTDDEAEALGILDYALSCKSPTYAFNGSPLARASCLP